MTAILGLALMLPFVGLALFAVPFSTLFLLSYVPSVTLARVAKGYLYALLASLPVTLLAGYIPYEASESHVYGQPETYGRELWINIQLVGDALILYILISVAVVVAPITFAATQRGFGSATWVMAAAGLASLILVPLLLLAYNVMSFLNVAGLLSVNLLLALSFSFGFGLPFLRARAEAAPPLLRGL